MEDDYRDGLEWACINMKPYVKKRRKDLPEAFLRPAYKYTTAEVKDRTQEDLHEYDYRK